jgi:hypothetical protein
VWKFLRSTPIITPNFFDNSNGRELRTSSILANSCYNQPTLALRTSRPISAGNAMDKPRQQSQLTTNQKVVVWVQGQLRKTVGKGECWDLAEQALKQAGAQTSNDLGPVEQDTDYIWGAPINDVKDVGPGDILQFRDHVVTTTIKTEYTFSDGSGLVETTEETAERGHHTAIVNGKLDGDGAVKTFDQHVRPLGKVVQNKKLHTRDVPPVATKTVEKRRNPTTKKLETAKVTKTIAITVTGTIWAYKPMAK